MSATTFFIVLACAVLAGLIASLICHLISPDLGEIAANIFFIVLLSLIAVGLIGFTTDPAQESTAEIQQSAADSVAIHTIQIIENDGSVSFEYRGNADVEIWPDHITLHDDDEMWAVFKNQDGSFVLESPQ